MKREQSIDVLRGLTIALMIIVNNPGSWVATYPPLKHASWNGFTLCDCVFPFFLFVMGVSMYFSFSKGGFKLSWKTGRRFLLLLVIGLLLNYVSGIVWGGVWSLGELRLTGVLVRFALCFGISALLVCKVNHKWLGWISAVILVGYALLLWLGNGYEYGPSNILSKADRWLLGAHMYDDNGIDPEGILSTVPAVAHTLIGFLVGKTLAEGNLRKMDVIGAALLTGGFLLMWALPLNKKIWSPSFVLVTCGAATLLLSMLHYWIDEKNVWKHTGFFKVFGTNAIFCYILSHVIAWVLDGSGLHKAYRLAIGDSCLLSLAYALAVLAIVYLIALPLYKKRIFIKL